MQPPTSDKTTAAPQPPLVDSSTAASPGPGSPPPGAPLMVPGGTTNMSASMSTTSDMTSSPSSVKRTVASSTTSLTAPSTSASPVPTSIAMTTFNSNNNTPVPAKRAVAAAVTAASGISTSVGSNNSSGSMPSNTAVAPQNPFDQVLMEETGGSGSTVSANAAAELLVDDLSTSSNVTPSYRRSPERSSSNNSMGEETSPMPPNSPSHHASPLPNAAGFASPATTTANIPKTSTTSTNTPMDISNSSRSTTPGGVTLPFVEGSSSSSSSHRPRTSATPSVAGTTPQPRQPTTTTPSQPVFEDDENTEPSSEPTNSVGQADPRRAGSFARLMEHAGMRRSTTSSSSNVPRDPLDDDDDLESTDRTLICGYLQKLGRNGKWQTRWFESDGECLSYYKSSKRTKLLATLDLAKVGAIEIDPDDAKGLAFTIQVLGRLYHLRTDSRASCKDWVITLNRVKEARLNQGRVKLVTPSDYVTPPDLLDQQSEDFVTPRVVVVANRQRLRAVDESNEWSQLIRLEDGTPAESETVNPYDHRRRSTLGTAVVARWTKRRSSLSRLGAKLARWARSLRKYKCSDIETESVHLDHHVHPPGHDDKAKMRMKSVDGASAMTSGGSQGMSNPAHVAQSPKPRLAGRGYSNASSDDEARMIS